MSADAAESVDRLDAMRSGPFAIWPEHKRYAAAVVKADAAFAKAQRAAERARLVRRAALRDALDAGMTQAQLARELGISRERVGQLLGRVGAKTPQE